MRLIIPKKRFFTLLELMIVLFILSMGMAVTGIKIKEAYEEQRLLSEVQQVANVLQTAQDFMLLLDADIEVRFSEDPASKQIVYWLEPKKALRPQWQRLIAQKQVLKSIKQASFERQTARSEKGIVLEFFSKGLAMSQGRLLLSNSEREGEECKAYQIELPGYPKFIESQLYQSKGHTAKDSAVSAKTSERLYPQEVIAEAEEKHEAPKA
jgi:prepilin-type N-terminal cleavage/methylation domain-containing protein